MTRCGWFVGLIPGRTQLPCKASVALGALPIREGRQTEDDSPFQYMSWIYLVLAGIGALGTFLVGILWFGDSSNVWRMLAATFLLIGIIGLKLAPGH